MVFTTRRALLGFFFVGAGGTAAAIGCSPSRDEIRASEAEHVVGEPLTLNDRHVWAQASEADFGKGMSTPGGESEPPIARTDATTVRLQQWLDRYHTIVGDLLAARGERLVAPKPSAALFKQFGPNAWVSMSVACPDWTLRPPSSGGGGTGPYLFLFGEGASSVDVSDRCLRPENWTDPAGFATFWNRQGTTCRVSAMAGSNELALSGCPASGGAAPLATYATSSTIGVTLDAISWGEELRVAVTLAHELGHYYRAHSNPLVKKSIDFFYRDAPGGPDRPVPAAESAEYEKILDDVRRLPPPVRLQRTTLYSKRLATVLYGLRSMCPQAQIDVGSLRALMGGQVTPANTSAYIAFENAMATCGKDVSIEDPTNRSQLEEVLRRSRIEASLSPGARTLDDALRELTTRLEEIDRKEAMLIDRVATGNFGWYTTEQEADEIGLELATRAGFQPADVITASLRTYEQLDAAYHRAGVDRSDEVSAATCKKWLAAGFTETDASGVKKPVRVPLGTLSDPHHAGCYRVYNQWRESKRHDYVVAAPMPELSPPWASLQAKALTLGATKPPVVDQGHDDADGGTTDPSGEGEDPETEAPPPRRPKTPTVEADAGASAAAPTTMTVTTGGCSAGAAAPPGAPFGLAGLLALALVTRRRRRA